MLRRLLPRADFVLVAAVLVASVLGVIMVASSTKHLSSAAEVSSSSKLVVQLFSLGIGVALMFLLMSVDYAKLLSLAPVFMGAAGLLLLITLVLGHAIRGSARWIPLGPVHLQPSEFAKIAVIIALAFYLSLRAEEGDVSTSRVFLQAGGIAAAPALLILLQPDLGTPILLFAMWLVVMFAAGARTGHLTLAVVVALVVSFGAWETNLIRPHQKARIMAFLNPDADPEGAGYHLRQSLIAVGSGHLSGKGLFQGTQSNLAFIPDQETDFIFAVIGEELGFVGGVATLALLGLIIWRCYAVAEESKDMGGRVLAVGVAAMFGMQVMVNVGMVLGMMPVKGLPLPFFSYGGSAMLANFMAVGLVQSVSMRRHKIAF